jgi:hypothetical protein
MDYKKNISILLMLLCSVFLINPARCSASEHSFAELLSNYADSYRLEKDASALTGDLSSKASDATGYNLWKTMWDADLSHEQRAANALKLISELFPGSDIKRWDEIGGFWYPAIVPKSLTAIDAVYVASYELVQTGDPAAAWIARNILSDLSESPKAKLYFMKTAPREYKETIKMLNHMGMEPATGNWIKPEVKGKLPLATPVHGTIPMTSAIGDGHLFLGEMGKITNFGCYTWDRESGRIYSTSDHDDTAD